MITAKFAREVSPRFFGAAAETGILSRSKAVGMTLGESAFTGFVNNALFKESDPSTNLLGARIVNGAGGALTFATMTVGTMALARAAQLSASRPLLSGVLSNRVFSGAVAGIPGALLGAEYDSYSRTGHGASAPELKRSAYSMAIIGGMFGVKESIFSKTDAAEAVPYSRFKQLEAASQSVLDGSLPAPDRASPDIERVSQDGEVSKPGSSAANQVVQPKQIYAREWGKVDLAKGESISSSSFGPCVAVVSEDGAMGHIDPNGGRKQAENFVDWLKKNSTGAVALAGGMDGPAGFTSVSDRFASSSELVDYLTSELEGAGFQVHVVDLYGDRIRTVTLGASGTMDVRDSRDPNYHKSFSFDRQKKVDVG